MVVFMEEVGHGIVEGMLERVKSSRKTEKKGGTFPRKPSQIPLCEDAVAVRRDYLQLKESDYLRSQCYWHLDLELLASSTVIK